MKPDLACVQCRDQLVDYAAGKLPAEARDLMARHLESCATCAEELEQWREIGAAVRETFVPAPQVSFESSWEKLAGQLDLVPSALEVRARVHWVEEAVKPWSPQYPPRSAGGRMRVLGACAAVLVLAVVSAGVFAALAINRKPLASGTVTAHTSATAYATPVPTAPPSRHSTGWHIVASPADKSVFTQLNGVAAVSANDVWAVGNNSFDYHGTAIEHWNGTSWSLVPHPETSPPNASDFSDSLYGVAAVSSNDVWAVGAYIPAAGQSSGITISQTLIEHWNGSSWSIVPSPNLGISNNQLSAVTAVSANDVWAVGSAGPETLVERWNGTRWSIIPSPSTLTWAALKGVTAVSADDVWAVGFNGIEEDRQSSTLIEHWNGSSWSMVPSPDQVPVPSSSASENVAVNVLYGVAAVSADDIWAVGYANGNGSRRLAEHWDGTRWSIVSTPSIASTATFSDPSEGLESGFRGIVAISADDVWAVGNGYMASGSPDTLIEHWNGQAWSVAPTPPSPKGHYAQNWLYGVAADSTGDIWAVGSDMNASSTALQGFVIQGP